MKNRISAILATFLLLFLLPGCSVLTSSSNTMTVLAGSELKDLDPLLDDIRRETGVNLEFEFIGTLDGAEQLATGANYDLGWFSHATYLTLLLDQQGRKVSQERIMLSPVVLGIKRSKAEAFGWVNNPDLTWRDIAEKSASGELRFAMTNPASSNSGFTALVGVASAFSGSGQSLQVADIDDQAMKDFFSGQTLTAGSSGWLADSYVGAQNTLDGLINYESVLLQLNKSGTLNEDLYLIYPKEGIITADYPIMLFNDEKKEQYDVLVDYLKSADFQQALMEQTTRRPTNVSVQLSNDFPNSLLVELPFPNRIEVINELIFTYLDEQRIPSHSVFVLDVSGSMFGDRLSELQAALVNLTGTDQSVTGQFSRFRSRERLTFMPFSSGVVDVQNFEVDSGDQNDPEMVEIRAYIDTLNANGGTAIFSSLDQAYQLVAQAQAADPNRYYSIVIMSDGENNEGLTERRFLSEYQNYPEDLQRVRTFAILFGDADADSMESIAEATGGRVFDGRDENLSFVFKQIRGYQ